MKIRWISRVILVSLLWAACAPIPGDNAPSSTPPNAEMTESSPQPAGADPTSISSPLPDTPDAEPSILSTGTPPPAAQEMLRLSVEALSRMLNINTDQISVVEAVPVIWPDASLGCPKPAIDYIRVETPGYRIVLESSGQLYNYHTDETRRVVLCNH